MSKGISYAVSGLALALLSGPILAQDAATQGVDRPEPARAAPVERPERAERPARLERPERPRPPARLERPGRPPRLERPERAKRLERPERSVRGDRPSRRLDRRGDIVDRRLDRGARGAGAASRAVLGRRPDVRR